VNTESVHRWWSSQGTRQVRVDRPGAGGEKLGMVRLCRARGVCWFGHNTNPVRRPDAIRQQTGLTGVDRVWRKALKWGIQGVIVDLVSRDLPVTPLSPTQGHETFSRLRRHLLKVMRPSRNPVVSNSRSWDLPATPSSSNQGPETFPWLCRHLLKVMRPSRDPVVADSRSWDLPATLSSPTQGHETFPWLPHRPLEVARPASVSVVDHFMSLGLPTSPSSFTSGRQTSLQLWQSACLSPTWSHFGAFVPCEWTAASALHENRHVVVQYAYASGHGSFRHLASSPRFQTFRHIGSDRQSIKRK
jgi:hypothetical protein